jgi:hypothetical protein
MKIRTIIILSVILALIISILLMLKVPKFSPFAISSEDAIGYINQNPEEVKELYNTNIDKAPGVIKSLITEEAINLTLNLNNGSASQLSIIAEDGKITQIINKPIDKYTLDIAISEQALNKITNSENQISEIISALDNNEITYNAKKTSTKAKLALSKILLKILD